jgi:hypothetical protein
MIDDPDYAIAWSVESGSDRVEVSANGLVSVNAGATAGPAVIRATVSNATSYYKDKEISVEVVPDTVANPFTPASGATDAALSGISLAFNQAVEVADASLITVNGDVAQSALAAGSVVTITPATLLNDADYTVTVGAGAIKAAASSLVNVGVYTWSFHTVKPAPTSVEIAGDKVVNLLFGNELQLTAEVLPENAIVKDIAWSIKSGTAVTVDANGKVSSVSAGVAIVKAAVIGYEGVYDTLKITVAKESLQVPEGYTFVFHETFENAVNGSLLSAANGTDETGYVIGSGGGNTKISGGVLTMLGSRWKTKNLDLTGDDVTLLVKVRNAATTDTTRRFQLALDTAGSSGVNNLGSYYITKELPASGAAFQTLTVSITEGTASSFIHFRTESNGSVDIDEIAIYKKVASEEPGEGGEQPGGKDPTTVATETYGLKLYPNPVRTELIISLDQEITAVELVDLMGSKVLSRKLRGAAAYTLNLQSVAAGRYVVVITLKNGAVIARIIVKQ